MSTLIDNLQSIYTTKLQIKEVIGTQSDVFETYPELIAAAIGTGGGIDWDEVAAYGYVVPAGTVTLSSNGTVDVSTYANAYVNVPQSGGITPTGYTSITTNGQYNVSTYQYAYVSVASAGGTELSNVFIADENDDTIYVPFTDNGTSYSYSWMFNWNGFDETWTAVGQEQAFRICCRVGSETDYYYDNENEVGAYTYSYRGVQPRVTNNTLNFGDLLDAIPTLDATSGYIDIAADLGGKDSEFYGNECWVAPDGFTPSYYVAQMQYTIDVPKNYYYNQGVGYDSVETGYVRTINHPTVRLSWECEGSNPNATSLYQVGVNDPTDVTYWTSSGNNFTRTMTFGDDHTDDYGFESSFIVVNGTEVQFSVWGFTYDEFLDENYEIAASGSFTRETETPGQEIFGSNLSGSIENYYTNWTLTVVATVPKDFYVDNDDVTFTWTFSGTHV